MDSSRRRCTADVVVPQANTTGRRRERMAFAHRQCSRAAIDDSRCRAHPRAGFSDYQVKKEPDSEVGNRDNAQVRE